MKLNDIQLRLQQLQDEINNIAPGVWIRPPQFNLWIDKLNQQIMLVNNQLNRQLALFGIQPGDLSSSGKTINSSAIYRLRNNIASMLQVIDENVKDAEDEKRRFQCFLTNTKCPCEIQDKRYDFFIGMPFSDENDDAYRYGIATILDSHGLSHYRADKQYERRELMCKICQAIQEATYVIIDLTNNNPNVMFELGLACGLEKQVILLKDSKTKIVSDLSGLEYIEYKNAHDLGQKLIARLQQWGLC